MSHDYKPGDPIEVMVGEKWRHDGHTYIGEWRGRLVYDSPNSTKPLHTPPGFVRPYTPPIEIPEGWTLMRADELVIGEHEVYDPRHPHKPWGAHTGQGYPMLVVARRRADA